MPLNPNLLERVVLFRLNRGPALLVDLFGAATLPAVTVASEVGVVDALADATDPLSSGDLAAQVAADPGGVEALCAFLVAEGYLTGDETGYRLAGMTKRWLRPGGDVDWGPWLRFWEELVLPFWAMELETAVRDGASTRSIYAWFDEDLDRWAIAQAGFKATAELLVDAVLATLSIHGEARVLDVGGGHNLYSMRLSQGHPAVSATLFHRPAAIDAVAADVPPEIRAGTTSGGATITGTTSARPTIWPSSSTWFTPTT